MIRKTAAVALLSALLGGCSYSYNLIAVAQNGKIVIEVDPSSPKQPACLRRIEVSAESEQDANWLESVGYDDDCANKFPLPYGHRLLGEHPSETPEVPPKPMRRETVYEMTATTGATGYGSGRFIIHADGRIKNLSREDEMAGVLVPANGS